MRRSINPKRIVTLVQKKEFLTFYNKEKAFKINIKPFHFYKILQKVGKSFQSGIDYISLVRVNQAEKEQKSFGTDKESMLEDFLNNQSGFLVLPKWNDNMDENDKMVIGIELKKNHLKKISSLIGGRWIDIMNYLQLSLISQSYEGLRMQKRNSLLRKKSMNTYIGLIRNLNSLKVSFPNNHIADLHGITFDKIQKLAQISGNDVIKSIGIQILGRDNKTIANRCKLFEQNLYEKPKDDEVLDTDEFYFYPVKQGAKMLKTIDLDDSGADDFIEALSAYRTLQKNIADKKEQIKEYCEKSENIYFEIDNTEGKKCYLNKCYFDYIAHTEENLPEKFKIKDTSDNYYYFKTDEIKDIDDDAFKNIFVRIWLPYSKNTCIINKRILVPVVEQMKSYKCNYEMQVAEFEGNEYLDVCLEDIILPEESDFNKASIETQIQLINNILDKKNNIQNDLKKEKCYYIEYEEGKLYNDSILPQIENYKDNIDIFYIPNKDPYSEKALFKANKKEIIEKGKEENAKYIKILDKDVKKIVSKKDLEEALNKWDENQSVFEITEYTLNRGKKKNQFDLNEVEIIEIAKEDLPIQVITENERLKNELKKDVNFLKTSDIKNNPILVREKLLRIIEEINPKSDIYDVYTKTRSDNRILKKIYTNVLSNPENQKYVELNIDQGNSFQSKSIVKRKMLEEGLQDEENDDCLLIDEFDSPLTVKKSTMHIAVPPEIHLPPQSKEQKE